MVDHASAALVLRQAAALQHLCRLQGWPLSSPLQNMFKRKHRLGLLLLKSLFNVIRNVFGGCARVFSKQNGGVEVSNILRPTGRKNKRIWRSLC